MSLPEFHAVPRLGFEVVTDIGSSPCFQVRKEPNVPASVLEMPVKPRRRSQTRLKVACTGWMTL
jgi:hypothetical protein